MEMPSPGPGPVRGRASISFALLCYIADKSTVSDQGEAIRKAFCQKPFDPGLVEHFSRFRVRVASLKRVRPLVNYPSTTRLTIRTMLRGR
jgi:hypothetical protein